MDLHRAVTSDKMMPKVGQAVARALRYTEMSMLNVHSVHVNRQSFMRQPLGLRFFPDKYFSRSSDESMEIMMFEYDTASLLLSPCDGRVQPALLLFH